MNLEEVAKRARVSTATVSRVLNNVAVVKAATRKRVLKAVSELNYTPNLHARTLAGGKSRTLGMIVSNMENPFFFDIFQSLDAAARRRGYEVVVAHTGYSPERLVSSIRLMLGRRVAGLAVIVSEMDAALIRELCLSKVRAVFYDVGTPGRNISNVRVNYRQAIQETVEYLYGLGHRRLAFIGHHSSLGPTSERERAFRDTVARYDAQWRSLANEDSPEGGRQAARELLASGFEPSAVLCVNDFMAMGVLRELHDQGRRVPQDVSVTGFDDIQLAGFSRPALTTWRIPRDRIGRVVFESLVPENEDSPPEGRELVLDPEFVVRESTAAALTGGSGPA